MTEPYSNPKPYPEIAYDSIGGWHVWLANDVLATGFVDMKSAQEYIEALPLED